MKRWIDILLATIALSSFSVVAARWVLPVMGLAGVEGELVDPLVNLMPMMVALFGITIVVLGLIMLRHSRLAYRHVTRLVDEADGWSDNFVIGVNEEINTDIEDQVEVLPFSTYDENGIDHTGPTDWLTEKLFQTGDPIDVSPADLIDDDDPELQPAVSGPAVRITAGYQNGVAKAFKYKDDPEVSDSFTYTQFKQLPAFKPHQLPPQLPEFAGRDNEMAELLAAQVKSENRILALHGMGGVGKTTLAVKVAHELAKFFPDAQIYMDLKGASTLPLPVSEAQSIVIRSYLPTARLPENEAELDSMYHSVLTGKKVLLLLDNAANAQQVIPLLPPEGSLSIITSRQDIDLNCAFKRRLDVLSLTEAKEMLTQIIPFATEYADRLVSLCGRLPLAIRLAAGAITSRPEQSIDEYIRKLSGVRGTPMPLRPIEAVIRTSYEMLSSDLQKLWRRLSVFSDTFDINAAAALWKVNPARATQEMDQLLAFSLVERNRLSGRYRLHDLMSRFADDRLPDRERTIALHRHSAHYQSVLHESDALYEQGRECLKQGLDLLDIEWHNIQAGQTWAGIMSENNRSACELCNSYPDAGKYVLDLRQHPRERIRWSEAALGASRILNRKKSTARHLVALGDSYGSLSEIDPAIECYDKALTLATEINDRPGEADALSGLGDVHFNCGEFEKAREYHEAVLNIAERMSDIRRQCHSMGRLAETVLAVGEAGNSKLMFDRQLKLARKLGDRRNESAALGGLAHSASMLGESHRSLDLFNQQLTITREIGDRRGEAGALCGLGHVCAGLKLHLQALTCLQQALSISREIGDKRNEAAALGGLGTAYFLNGEVDVAEQFFDQQLDISREINDRRGEITAMICRSEAFNADDDPEQAAELSREALLVAREIGDILGQANALFTLAHSLDKNGDRSKAISQVKIALEFFEFVEHPKAETARKILFEWTQCPV